MNISLGKKKRHRILTYCLIMMFIFMPVCKSSFVYAKNYETNVKKVILIDPGHGGYDAGASSKSGLQEKEVNLKISLKIKEGLKKAGYDVFMTREEDKSLNKGDKKFRTKKAEDLYNRCNMKTETNCNLFISIHQNTFPETKYYGSQVWYSKNEESRKLAHIVQENLKSGINNNNNRVEKPARDDFRILACKNDIPSILVECGFLSNSDECELLGKDEYQSKIADIIVQSVEKYFKESL